LATILDAEDNVIILAFAIVPSESLDSWNFLFQNLEFAVEVDNDDIVIISDRDKGLGPASSRTISNAIHSHCCIHIAANVQCKYKTAAKKAFWNVTYASSD
jgi:transposase-like protein